MTAIIVWIDDSGGSSDGINSSQWIRRSYADIVSLPASNHRATDSTTVITFKTARSSKTCLRLKRQIAHTLEHNKSQNTYRLSCSKEKKRTQRRWSRRKRNEGLCTTDGGVRGGKTVKGVTGERSRRIRFESNDLYLHGHGWFYGCKRCDITPAAV